MGLVQEESTGLDDDFVPLLSISFDVDLEVSKLNVVDKRRKNPWARLEGTVSHSKNVPSKKLTTVEAIHAAALSALASILFIADEAENVGEAGS